MAYADRLEVSKSAVKVTDIFGMGNSKNSLHLCGRVRENGQKLRFGHTKFEMPPRDLRIIKDAVFHVD